MKYVISIEGQSIDLPEEIAGDDAKLKAALSPFFPGAANSKIMRNPEKDGVINITVIKQAGTKGNGLDADMAIYDDDLIRSENYRTVVINAPRFGKLLKYQQVILGRILDALQNNILKKLIKAKEGQNPVVELHQEIASITTNQMPAEQLMRLDAKIEKVVKAGEEQHQGITRTRELLIGADPQPSTTVPAGF